MPNAISQAKTTYSHILTVTILNATGLGFLFGLVLNRAKQLSVSLSARQSLESSDDRQTCKRH